MVTDTVADLLTRIRNASRSRHQSVQTPKTALSERVLEVLKNEGFIESYTLKAQKSAKAGKFSADEYQVVLKYFGTGEPAISMARRVSKPGRRIYAGANDLPKIFNGLGVSLVSTSQGVMSDREARRRKIGGEILATIG
jgi:small subunit ribosomal protein S8